ncbi:MAG: hypothetical protein ACOZF2_00500 [Thermodesulfobacteriota bacterium]
MKIFGLLLVMALLVAGCATFQHSELIATDQQGYATGRYSSDSQGPTGRFGIAGTGAGWGAGGVGFGGLAAFGKTGPPEITPIHFAKSIAIINYSKKLKSIKYDEIGGIVEYEFEEQPTLRTSSKKASAMRSSLPASFGHQPIE